MWRHYEYVEDFTMPLRVVGRPWRCASLYLGPQFATDIAIATQVINSPQSDSVPKLNMVARSHAGLVRPNNEDSIGFVAAAGVAVLADGMGGLNAGEVASRHAVDLVLQGLAAGLPLQQVVEDANRTVFELSQNDSALNNMGTTLVAMQLVGDQLWLANVGDSRIYRFRAGTLSQLTHDHSVVQQFVDSGLMSAAEARVAPNRNIITRALGIEGGVEVDVLSDQPQVNDLYMLCSDGVTDMLAPDALEDLFVAHVQPSELVDAIVDASNAAGGVDNISAVLVHVEEV